MSGYTHSYLDIQANLADNDPDLLEGEDELECSQIPSKPNPYTVLASSGKGRAKEKKKSAVIDNAGTGKGKEGKEEKGKMSQTVKPTQPTSTNEKPIYKKRIKPWDNLEQEESRSKPTKLKEVISKKRDPYESGSRATTSKRAKLDAVSESPTLHKASTSAKKAKVQPRSPTRNGSFPFCAAKLLKELQRRANDTVTAEQKDRFSNQITTEKPFGGYSPVLEVPNQISSSRSTGTVQPPSSSPKAARSPPLVPSESQPESKSRTLPRPTPLSQEEIDQAIEDRNKLIQEDGMDFDLEGDDENPRHNRSSTSTTTTTATLGDDQPSAIDDQGMTQDVLTIKERNTEPGEESFNRSFATQTESFPSDFSATRNLDFVTPEQAAQILATYLASIQPNHSSNDKEWQEKCQKKDEEIERLTVELDEAKEKLRKKDEKIAKHLAPVIQELMGLLN